MLPTLSASTIKQEELCSLQAEDTSEEKKPYFGSCGENVANVQVSHDATLRFSYLYDVSIVQILE